jgi:uncharacterized membrane protein
MNTNKFLVGGIIGGVTNFFLGWLIYGMMLMNFMQSHSNNASGVFRTEETMIWWALILGNLAFGFLLSYILNKSNVNSAMAGATVGAVVGFLMSLAIDFSIYAQVNLWDTTAMAVDIIASTVMSAIAGAAIGWYLGRGK